MAEGGPLSGMTDATIPVAVWIDIACALAYAGLAAHLARATRARRLRPFLVAGALATAAWAGLAAVRDVAIGADWPQLWSAAVANLAQGVQSVAWLAALAAVLAGDGGWRRGLRRERDVAAAVALLFAALGAVPLLWASGAWSGGAVLPILGGLGLAIVGLVVVENVGRGAGTFWSVKLLCLGVGGIFAYDFFLYSTALLFWQIDLDLLQARAAAHLVLVPVLAAAAWRRPEMRSELAVSHRLALRTAALVGAGCYMIVMGAVGLYVREFGGRWGPLLQTGFLFASLVLLTVLVASGRIQAHLRVLIAKHFFAYKYDYREEWLRFIAAVTEGEAGRDMRRRVIAAVAGIVDSPGGALWQRDDGGYHLVTTWNQSRSGLAELAEEPLCALLGQQGWIVQVAEWRQDPARYGGLELPEWLAESGLWLLVPLIRRDGLMGFLALQPPRAPRSLDWEDFDLLKTAAREAASHLSEHEAMRALADARQLELFNRRFAFVVHDIKTVISQLSLLLANADRHRDNPEFQRDLVLSVRESVEAMTTLLAHINAERGKEKAPLDLAAAARAQLARLQGPPPVAADMTAGPLEVAADKERIDSILAHLLHNARDAAGPRGTVVLRLHAEAARAVLEVEDDGPGMDAEFVRDQLFRPFASTKADGLGIGAYQCRELVRELGGQLSVDSAPGHGTTMRVILPLALPQRPSMETTQPRKVALP